MLFQHYYLGSYPLYTEKTKFRDLDINIRNPKLKQNALKETLILVLDRNFDRQGRFDLHIRNLFKNAFKTSFSVYNTY